MSISLWGLAFEADADALQYTQYFVLHLFFQLLKEQMKQPLLILL